MENGVHLLQLRPNEKSDVVKLFAEASDRWFTTPEIVAILSQYQKFVVDTTVPKKPAVGSIFLIDRKQSIHFREDGYIWPKAIRGKPTERRVKLEVGSKKVVKYSSAIAVGRILQRRIYWLIQRLDRDMDVVFVHYRSMPPDPSKGLSPIHASMEGGDGNTKLETMETFPFTSEFVTEGHPDKLCHLISDAVLDACLAQDPESKVDCWTSTAVKSVSVFGEITTEANVDYEKIVRDTCRKIGFVSEHIGLDADKCEVRVEINQQRPDIAQGVHGHLTKQPEDVGADYQGHVFGYATDETLDFMPLSQVFATVLGCHLTEVRKNGTCPWLRPHGKTKVTVDYYNDNGAMVPKRVHSVVISTQHDETVTEDQIAADLMEYVIKPGIPNEYLDEKTIFNLNPIGPFFIGGPLTGLFGPEIIIEPYGGWGADGGGRVLSGKDATKVVRGGAYIARQAAKSVVVSKLARRCIVQVSYAIGVPKPVSVLVDTYGAGKIPDNEILKIVKEAFDFRPGMVATNLDLKRGIFFKTAACGHFGWVEPEFTWEVVKPLKWEKPEAT